MSSEKKLKLKMLRVAVFDIAQTTADQEAGDSR